MLYSTRARRLRGKSLQTGALSMLRIHLALPFLAALALLAGACGGGDDGPKSVPANAVAVVGDQTISKDAFDQLIGQARRTAKQQKRSFPKAGTPEFASLRQNAVQYLVQRAEFAQKADEMDVEVSDKDVDKRLGE